MEIWLIKCILGFIKVVDGSGDNNIVLRMARSVRAEAMVDAVERSVRPRMKGKDSGALEVLERRTKSLIPYQHLQSVVLIHASNIYHCPTTTTSDIKRILTPLLFFFFFSFFSSVSLQFFLTEWRMEERRTTWCSTSRTAATRRWQVPHTHMHQCVSFSTSDHLFHSNQRSE